MASRKKILEAVLAALLGVALTGQAYERELSPRSLREAFFLGKDTTFRSGDFFKGYVRTFPVPKQGVQVAQIEMGTPFKQIVTRARQAPDGYNPLQAESEYRRQPPRLIVEVTLWLTPTFPAHSPYTIPAFSPIYFREPSFWQAFQIHLVQGGEVAPRGVKGDPFYSCDGDGNCWLAGAVVRLEFDPDQVASRPTRISVLTPDGQRVEAEFDLGRLR